MPSDDTIARFREIAGGDTASWGGVDAETDGRRIFIGRRMRFMRHSMQFAMVVAILVLFGIGLAFVRHAWHAYSLFGALIVVVWVAKWLWRVLNELPRCPIAERVYDIAVDADTRSIEIRGRVGEAGHSVAIDDIEYLVYYRLIACSVRSIGVYAVTADRTSYQLIKYSISDAGGFLRVLGYTCDKPAIVLDAFKAAREHRDSPYWSLTRDQVDMTDRDALLKWGEAVYSPGELQPELTAEETGI